MGVLSDPKLERFAQALLRHLANGLTGGKAATRAALEAGYSGSSVASNARKRAQRPDVKARMVELAAPRQAEVEAEIAETVEAVTTNLFRMALKKYDQAAIKPEHSIKASDLLAKIKGWNAPERVEHTLNGLGDRLDRALAGSGDSS
jgi:phage terminase small subunit